MCEQKAMKGELPDTWAPVEQTEGISILNPYPTVYRKDEIAYQTML
jgi:hypothetical protein